MKTGIKENDLTKMDFSDYDVDFLGVHCSGVHWGNPTIYLFTVGVEEFRYVPPEKVISAVTDLDNIKIAIEDYFLPWYYENHKEEEAEQHIEKDYTDCPTVIRQFRFLVSFSSPSYISPCFATFDVGIEGKCTKEKVEEVSNALKEKMLEAEPQMTAFSVMGWSEFEEHREN